MGESNIFVGKQAIFDRKGNIYGYELLYRSSEENRFVHTDPEQATVELLINTFTTIGIDNIVGKTKSFINFPQSSLEKGIADTLDPRFVIVEVLEDVEFTNDVMLALRKLKKRGFKIALDDFVLDPNRIIPNDLYRLIDIIKVDFLLSDYNERRKVESIAKRYPNISLLAEKIETDDEYNEAQRHGYALFQGYFFSKPEIVKGKEIPSNYMIHFQIIKELNEEEPDVNRISNLLMHDISLSYKLLRYINSVTFDIPNEVSSINQAIMLMGLDEAKRWFRILLLREMGVGSGRGRERALVDRSLVRAKICELVAKEKRIWKTDEYFLTGLFSLIDIIMRNELEFIIPQLSLSNEISQTLLGKETKISPYLQLAIALEEFKFEEAKEAAQQIGIEAKRLSEIVQEAHHWATLFD